MQTVSKALVGTIAAGAMAIATASPAQARDRYRGDDGIDVGDVIAGALIIGGIAAVASAANRDRHNYRYDDYRYRDRDWRDYERGYYRRDTPRSAVEQCVYAAERAASRYSYRGHAKVTDIRSVRDRRDGYRVTGRIAVNQNGRDWRRGDRHHGYGWDDDYRGWDRRYQGYDAGRFTCEVSYGRVVDLDFSGIRGL